MIAQNLFHSGLLYNYLYRLQHSQEGLADMQQLIVFLGYKPLANHSLPFIVVKKGSNIVTFIELLHLCSMAKKIKTQTDSSSLFFVVGVGASAGGLDAFKEFLQALPEKPGMAIVFLQHLHPDFKSSLPQIIQRETKIPVMEITDGLAIKPDQIYILPANKLLYIQEGRFVLQPRQPANELSHPIDLFFASLAEAYQSHAMGIVLSGLGSDGTIGLKKIKDLGGISFAQEMSSAGFDSMPGNAINAGVVDFVLLPQEMPGQLIHIDQAWKKIPVEEPFSDAKQEEDNFRQILAMLRVRRGVDFTYYKQSTIRRRILRRMAINKLENLKNYLEQLRASKTEQDILYQDMLIPVTSFFRDTEVFDCLSESILPEIARNKTPNSPLRIWVAGCSTGEEAYSIAMCLCDSLGEKLSSLKVQIFATDISEKAIIKARSGMYDKRDLEGVSEHRLREYFYKTDGSYQIKKHIRNLCVFATHNLLKDPPFARIDLLSCRNVLIYLEGYLQKKALGIFHYALNEKGILLLGKSEAAGFAEELFVPLKKQAKLYSKKQVPVRPVSYGLEKKKLPQNENEENNLPDKKKNNFQENADEVLLARFSPPGVIVNEQYDIVQFRGATGQFLEASPGKASLNIFKMLKDGMGFEVRNALHKAKMSSETVIKENIHLKGGHRIDIEVIPLMDTIDLHFLVLFKDSEKNTPAISKQTAATGKKVISKSAEKNRIAQLEKDLSQSREDMHSITEDQEAANEELQSANEELLSGREEMQSMNEELETSKEELQSTNEELMTINQELFDRSEQYNQARLYTETIVKTIHEPIIVLNKELRIKSANQSFYDTFSLKEEEIAGKIIFELQEAKWDMPELRSPILRIQSGKEHLCEWEVKFPFHKKGPKVFYFIAQTIEGPFNERMILLAIDDITLRKKEIDSLKSSADEIKKELLILEKFFLQAPAGFCILNGPDLVFKFANPAYNAMFGIKDPQGKSLKSVFRGREKAADTQVIEKVYKTGESYMANEVQVPVVKGGKKENIYLDLSYHAFRNELGQVNGILAFFYDVTEKITRRLQWEATSTDLMRSNKNLQQFASIASHDLQEPLRKVQTFISILTRKHPEPSPEKQKELISKIDQSVKRMSVLVKDVLNYSRLTNTEANFYPVDLNVVLKTVLKEKETLIMEKKAIIKCDTLPELEAIPMQMNQLFNNLIGNALKFSKESGTVKLHIQYRKPKASDIKKHAVLNEELGYAEIIFHDNGIGFEQEFAEQIFLIFQRLNDMSKYPGTGIGLALCQNIVFAHHGIIWATSKETKGSSFHVILPMKQKNYN